MNGGETVRENLKALSELALEVGRSMSDEVAEVADLTVEILRRGGRLFFCGNGGSAARCSI